MKHLQDHRLSETDRERKAQLRAHVLLAAVERRTFRRRRRAVLAACTFLIASGLCALIATAGRTGPSVTDTLETASASSFTVQFITTQPGIAEKYLVAPASTAQIIDDSTLLALIDGSEQPTALVYSHGHLAMLDLSGSAAVRPVSHSEASRAR